MKIIKSFLIILCIAQLNLFAGKKPGKAKQPSTIGTKKQPSKAPGKPDRPAPHKPPSHVKKDKKTKIGPGKAGKPGLRTGKITKRTKFSKLSKGEQAYWRSYKNAHAKNASKNR